MICYQTNWNKGCVGIKIKGQYTRRCKACELLGEPYDKSKRAESGGVSVEAVSGTDREGVEG